MDCSWDAICCSVRSGAAAAIPATSTTRRSLAFRRGALSRRLRSAIPSATSRRTVRRSRSAVHRTSPVELRTRITSSQGFSGLSLRTIGNQLSMLETTLSICTLLRAARATMIAVGSRARSPGLPPRRPRALAARRPAFVRSEVRARSSCATAPSTCNENIPCGVVVSTGSRRERK